MRIPGYRIREEISRDDLCLIARANRVADEQKVFVKAPLAPSPASVALLRREYDLVASLRLDSLPRPRGFEDVAGALVYEDTGARSVREMLRAGRPRLDAVLESGVRLATAIAGLHGRRTMHRGINPDSVFFEPASHAPVLIDLGAASRLLEEAPNQPPLLPGDRLAFIAPEQTGRMNRLVDHRADLYAVGALLYFMLTGQPPFSSEDPLEIIHWQIAKVPPAPSVIDATIPATVSGIVMKLLAKKAEDRYQTASGLAADLQTCLKRRGSEGAIPPFPLGEQDVSDRFTIPQRLYGRETECELLLRAFERACRGTTVLTLVAGYSGVGKTSLVNEVHKPIARERGRFVMGKFDLLERHVPYGALLQALRDLVQQVLAESEERVSAVRERLRDALGANAGVIVAVLPQLELLLGHQLAAPPLPAAEAQNRFNRAFAAFLGAFARPEHPLVIFLDDVQWADSATLKLVPLLLTDPGVRYLLVIAAYRDNEVSAGHPLLELTGALGGAGVAVERIAVPPLLLEHLTELVGAALRRTDDEAEPLARLVLRKTDGNPFFVSQFLRSLVRDGFVAFDRDRRSWMFDLARIEGAQITANVVDLMTQRLQKLSSTSRETLTLAACVGNSFSLATLGVIRQRSPRQVAGELWEAVEEGLVLHATEQFEPLAGAPDDVLQGAGLSFRFLHDRVQQAAYALVPEDRKGPLHLRVGQLLLAECGEAVPEERVFEIVHHLNLGQKWLPDEASRTRLAQLDLAAGRKAKASAAFQAAREYFESGRRLLTDERWETDYELTFALHLEGAESTSVCGMFEEAERSFRSLLERARTRLDKAKVYRLEILQHESLSRYADAIRTGREALALFGVPFPDERAEREAVLEAELSSIEAFLGQRPIESLIDLPTMRDPEIRTVMKLLTNLHTSCFLSGDRVLTRLNTATMVRLSLEHGNCEESAYGYVLHAAMLIIPVREDFAAAYGFGTLAMRLAERLGSPALRAKVLMNFAWAISPFRMPMRASVPITHEAFRLGNESGLFVESSYALFNECWFALLSGPDLASLERTAVANVDYVRRVKMDHFAAALQTIQQWGRALQGRTASPSSLSDDSFDEAAFETAYRGEDLFEMFYLDAKLALLYTFGDWRAACRVAARAEAVIREFTGTIWDELRVYYHALALAALHSVGEPEERLEAEGLLSALHARMQLWAESSPANFRAQYLIVSAELARVQGRERDAIASYEAALGAAAEQECPRERALANELYAGFWRERGQLRAASVFTAAARDAYAEWGASAKVDELESKHPALSSPGGHGAGALDSMTATKAAHAIASEIELPRVLKALIRIAIENAGAVRGAFLQEREGRLFVVARGALGSEGSVLTPELPLESCDDLSQAVVRVAHRTGESVLVADAGRDPRWANDPYVVSKNPKSILSVPVVHQGRRKGLLYLENDLLPEAFTSKRIEMMQVLSTQAAIALENAQLYDEMRQEVARRGAAERALRDALAEVQALKERLQAENVYLQEEIRTQHNFDEIVGNSKPLLGALRMVEKVAPTDSTVLVFGETGTGKELFARAIHSRSARRDRPLVKVNCGAIAPGLVESELFGHVKGAFTGALQSRTGRFELANGGTIFLDEVSELPPDTQVKLLRVLQEREFDPVGSSRTLRVDVRVIAASNRKLDEAVQAGRFRADLLYRLNVFPVEVPALRERRADIPLLVSFFVGRLAKKLGKPLEGVSRKAMERLMEYPWPGNVRELQNVIERAAILSRGPLIDLETEVLAGGAPPGPDSRAATLEGVERTYILQTLETTGWVVEGPHGAATILGLHPNTLRSRMKKLGISRPRADGSRDVSHPPQG